VGGTNGKGRSQERNVQTSAGVSGASWEPLCMRGRKTGARKGTKLEGRNRILI